MSKHVFGVYSSQELAEKAATMLAADVNTKTVSFLHKAVDGDTHHTKQKEDVATGSVAGGIGGSALGASLGVAAQTVTVGLPVGSLLVFGPLAPLMGLAGAATGAALGSLVGALTDLGLTESVAQKYQTALLKGETIVGTRVEDEFQQTAVSMLESTNAQYIQVVDPVKSETAQQ